MYAFKLKYGMNYILDRMFPYVPNVNPGRIPGVDVQIIAGFNGRNGWVNLERGVLLNVLNRHLSLTRKANWYPSFDGCIPKTNNHDQHVIDITFDKNRTLPLSTNYVQELINGYVHRLMTYTPFGFSRLKVQHFDLLKPLYYREVYYGFHSEEEELAIDDFDVVGNLSELFPARVSKPLQYAQSLRVFLARAGWLFVRGNKRIIMMG